MKIKTSEATGLQLDWGLGLALQAEKLQLIEGGVIHKPSSGGRQVFRHTDPSVWGDLSEQYKMDVTWGTSGKVFVQMSDSDDDKWHGGKTLAEAVARCVIAMRLGDEFEVPDELGVQS